MPTHYSQRPYDFETGCSGLECVAASAIDHTLVFLWVGLAALAVLGLVFLPKAREACESERERTRTEARAFDRFARRIDRIETASPETTVREPAAGPRTKTLLRPPDATGDGIRDVREAYRETVMSVPHYEEEYDEPLAENVAAEFDPDAAAALASGDRLTPQVERALVQAATDAREGREDLVDALNAEIASLESYGETLSGLERSLDRLDDRPLPGQSFDELRERWREVDRLRTELGEVLADRQDEIQSGHALRGGFPDPWTMYAYFYQSIPTTHPVLREGARVLADLSTAEDRLARALSRRA
ncbi:hypothetical protein [Saliphagus sp. LR7]|uniref:DUF7260 family protein n=1 Tax=Saliphagus sp. LR7 TaxID=2282654 RepID=UPI000DF84762|nr:hypothetical protein [Saliphagus sp. LR7]